MVRVNRRRSIASLSATVAMLLATATHAQTFKFELPAQPLQQSLRAISQQANVNILFDSDTVDGLYAPALNGDLTVQEAIRLLTSDKKLTVQQPAQDTITVSRLMTATSTRMRRINDVREQDRRSMRVAQAAAVAAEEQTSTSAGADNAKPDTNRIQLEEVVVTGSHIRGAQNLSSPVITFTREDIEASGYSTTQQFIQSLPQNVNSLSDMSAAGFAGGVANSVTYDGSGMNLRGLGGDATLILVNGRRLAGAGDGSFVDISLIPLSVVDRIDVLTDGASAIYGSDAVAGVVNLVLRQGMEGAETRLRFGAVTEGSHNEKQVGQSFGHSWATGDVLLSYEYFKRTPLDASGRSFFEPTIYYPELELISRQDRHSALAMVNQRLSDRVSLSTDLFYAQRDSHFGYVGFGDARDTVSDVRQYGGSLNLSVAAANGWHSRLSGVLHQNDSAQLLLALPTRAQVGRYGNESQIRSLDLSADGPMMRLPGGDVRLALGGQVRREEFVEKDLLFPATLDRETSAVFAELLVPLVGEHNRRDGVQRLEMTLAARYEDYSDFGTTFNPKIGLSWEPLRGLNVRGTWGTSFKAPLLAQLNSGNQFAQIFEGYFRDVSGTPTGLYLQGNGVDLGPEESRNWTVGFDLEPQSVPGLSVSATYFDIDYDQRISSPFPIVYELSEVLFDPTSEVVITRNPGQTYVQSLLDSIPNVFCVTYVPTLSLCDAAQTASQIGVLVDGRLRNFGGVRMRGIDLMLGYRLTSALGDWAFLVAGSQLLENQQQLVPGASSTSAMNAVGRPVDFRLRNTILFSHQGLNVSAAVNYVDGYRDLDMRLTGSSGRRNSVSSWTTVDLAVAYSFEAPWARAGTSRTELQVSAVNLFDKDPPYVANNWGVHFDGVNANPRGRFLSAQIAVQW